jgi:putative membrane protein
MTPLSLGAVLALTYEWIKAGHVIFVIFWIAGLFMLPRYYIYHQESPPGSAEEKRWIDRERKLRNIILTPSMILVWVFGLTLAWQLGLFAGTPGLGWLHLKILLVFGLSGYHGYMIGYGKKLARGERPISGKALRLMNEIPGIVAAAIVILVVLKPF